MIKDFFVILLKVFRIEVPVFIVLHDVLYFQVSNQFDCIVDCKILKIQFLASNKIEAGMPKLCFQQTITLLFLGPCQEYSYGDPTPAMAQSNQANFKIFRICMTLEDVYNQLNKLN